MVALDCGCRRVNCSRGQTSSSVCILGSKQWLKHCVTLRRASEEEASLHSRSGKERKQYVDFNIGRCEQEALLPSCSVYHPSVCGAEEESSRVLHLCRKEGGGGFTWMFQQTSQMWLMLSLLERTRLCTLWISCGWVCSAGRAPPNYPGSVWEDLKQTLCAGCFPSKCGVIDRDILAVFSVFQWPVTASDTFV